MAALATSRLPVNAMGSLTNTAPALGQPLPTTPMVGPRLPAPLTAPAPTPYGSFTPPNLSTDPTYQADLEGQQQAVQRSAAARGTLLTGGLMARLQTNASNVANTHLNDLTARSLDAYRANRDTNAQNFGQTMGSFGAQQDVYHNAVDAATTGANVTNANASSADTHRQAMVDYQAFIDAQRQAETARQNAATTAAQGTFPVRPPLPGDPGRFMPSYLGAF